MDPGSSMPGSKTPPLSDTGPSFMLTNMANSDVFNCTTSGKQNSTFDGSCKPASAATSSSTAKFHFDPELDMLEITQHWNCGNSYVANIFEAKLTSSSIR